jgi:hypothetical protein
MAVVAEEPPGAITVADVENHVSPPPAPEFAKAGRPNENETEVPAVSENEFFLAYDPPAAPLNASPAPQHSIVAVAVLAGRYDPTPEPMI